MVIYYSEYNYGFFLSMVIYYSEYNYGFFLSIYY